MLTLGSYEEEDGRNVDQNEYGLEYVSKLQAS